MVLLHSVFKSSLGKACFHFICDIWWECSLQGGEEGELDSLEATVDVWHRESEMTKREKSSLTEFVALNNLKGGPGTEFGRLLSNIFAFSALIP